MNDIIAIVVTYNRKLLLLQCIEHILAQKDASCDIYVIDNASTDGTAEAIAIIPEERIIYYHSSINLGGAGGFNLGMRYAIEHHYKRIWLMDDDVFPKEYALSQLVVADKLTNGDFGWLSSVALWLDNTECRMNRQKLKKSYYQRADLLPNGLILAEQATFVSLYLNCATVQEVGLPIKEFFIWGDDIEYTRRIAVRRQMPCYLALRSVVIHVMKSNNGNNVATDDPSRLSRYRLSFRNEAFLYRQEGFIGSMYYLAKCMITFYRILRYAPGQRLRRIWIMLISIISGVFFHPKIEHFKDEEPKSKPCKRMKN